MKKIVLFCTITGICISSCRESDRAHEFANTDGTETISSELFDLNNDGVDDVSYEFEGAYYYELVDRNFDTRVDESGRFRLNDVLVSRRIDSNFDGILETEVLIQNGSASKITSDTDNDGIVDLVFTLRFGEILFAEKYLQSYGDELSRISKINFEFGFPISEAEIITTSLTVEEFAQER